MFYDFGYLEQVINEKLKNGLLPKFSCLVPGQEKNTKLFIRRSCVFVNSLLSKGISVLLRKRCIIVSYNAKGLFKKYVR